MQNLRSYSSAKLAALAVVLMSAVSAAQAEIPAAVGTAFAAVETDAQSLFTMVIPYIVGILGMFVVIKLIKRFGSKF